jgi:hypothetical protein
MRFTKFAVLAIVAPVASAFMPIANQRVTAFNIKQPTTTLSMSLEDLEGKLFSSPAEVKSEPVKKQKPAPAPKAPKAAPAPKAAAKKAEAVKEDSIFSTSDLSFEPAGKPKAKKPEKPAPVKKEKPAPVVREKPVRVIKEKPVKVEKPKPVKVEKPKPVKVEKPKPVKKVVAPTPVVKKMVAPKAPMKKPAAVATKPSDATTVAEGLALGAAPLIVAPLVALAAGRSFLSKTAARRQVIQEASAAKALKEKKKSEVDPGGVVAALVRNVSSILYLTVACRVSLVRVEQSNRISINDISLSHY